MARRGLKLPGRAGMAVGIGLLLLIAVVAVGGIYLSQDKSERDAEPVATTDEGQAGKSVSPDGKPDSPLAGKSADLEAEQMLREAGVTGAQIAYLAGEAKTPMSTEEKQKLRDLLLEKLSSKQIKMLTAINDTHANYVTILDRSYPIELVGVYDVKERERILAELQPSNSSPSAGEAQASSEPSPKSSPPTSSDAGATSGVTNDDSAALSSATSEREKRQQQIDAKYDGQIEALRISCSAKVSELSSEVKSYIQKAQSSGETVTVTELQSQFMDKIASAESGCDGSFAKLLASAKVEYEEAGITSAKPNEWKAEYDKDKSKARTQALSRILSAWKAGS